MLSRNGRPMRRSSATNTMKTRVYRYSKRLRGRIPESVYRLSLDRRRLRGSPSLVGRGIANPVRSALGGSNPPPRAVAPCACERTMRSIHLRHSDLAWSPSDLRGTKQRCAEFARTTGRTSRSSRCTRRSAAGSSPKSSPDAWPCGRRMESKKSAASQRWAHTRGSGAAASLAGSATEEVVEPNMQDVRAAVAVREGRAETGVGTVNWIAARSDVRRFRSLGYTVDGPFPDTTMAVSLVKEIRTTDLPRRFGGMTGKFVQYPTDDF